MVDLISDTNGQDRIFFLLVASVGEESVRAAAAVGFTGSGLAPPTLQPPTLQPPT